MYGLRTNFFSLRTQNPFHDRETDSNIFNLTTQNLTINICTTRFSTQNFYVPLNQYIYIFGKIRRTRVIISLYSLKRLNIKMTKSLRLTHHVLLMRGYMFRSLVTIIRTFCESILKIRIDSQKITSKTSCFIGARLHVSVFSDHHQALL